MLAYGLSAFSVWRAVPTLKSVDWRNQAPRRAAGFGFKDDTIGGVSCDDIYRCSDPNNIGRFLARR